MSMQAQCIVHGVLLQECRFSYINAQYFDKNILVQSCKFKPLHKWNHFALFYLYYLFILQASVTTKLLNGQ